MSWQLDAHPDGSPEWHAQRAQGIGGSDIAAVLGLSPWKSAFTLWHEKKGNIPAGNIDPELSYWGHAHEPTIAQRFTEEHPEYVVAPTSAHCHDKYTWARVNPDRLLHDHGTVFPSNKPTATLQIKTARYPDGWGKSGSDEMPMQYLCQVLWEAFVMDADIAWLAVLIGGNDYREYRIERDPEDESSMFTAAERFWQSVQDDDEPPLDVSDSTYQTVRSLHPAIDRDETVDIPPNLAAAYHTTKQDADHAEEQHRLAKTQLLTVMGDARIGTVAEQPAFRRQPARGGKAALYVIT